MIVPSHPSESGLATINLDIYKNSVTVLTMITTEQIDELNKMGLGFYYSNISKEYLSDANGYEMGISYDPLHVGHSAPFTLRTRKWDEDTCQYEDEYERFETFQELKAYIT